VFVMLSGALLLHPSGRQTTGEFYRRRVGRLGIATAFWSIFFMAFAVYVTGWAKAGWSTPDSIWRSLLIGQPYPHLGFIFRLGGLYLITPLLRVYVHHAPLRLRALMLAIILGLAMANSLAAPLLGTQTSSFAIFWAFLGYYLAGDVLRTIPATRRLAVASAAVYVLCVLAVAGTTGLLAPVHVRPQPYPAVEMILYDFLSPPRVAMAFAAWFMLAYAFGRLRVDTPIQRLMAFLGPLTLGIYLVHPLFRDILWKWDVLSFRSNFWVGMPLAIVAVALASTLLTWVLSRIPGVRRTVT
jgi:surface polysaccharide O-acyltransferase-like enzyme